MSELQPGQYEQVILHYGFPAFTLNDVVPTRETAEEYAAMLIGHKVSDFDPETATVSSGRVIYTYLEASPDNPLQGRVMAVCEPLEAK